MTRPVRTDALSLTLPKPTSRSRARRRRRPPRLFWWYVAWTIWSIGWAVFDVLTGSDGLAVWMALAAGWYWREAMRALQQRAATPPLQILAFWAIWAFTLLVFSVAGIWIG